MSRKLPSLFNPPKAADKEELSASLKEVMFHALCTESLDTLRTKVNEIYPEQLAAYLERFQQEDAKFVDQIDALNLRDDDEDYDSLFDEDDFDDDAYMGDDVDVDAMVLDDPNTRRLQCQGRKVFMALQLADATREEGLLGTGPTANFTTPPACPPGRRSRYTTPEWAHSNQRTKVSKAQYAIGMSGVDDDDLYSLSDEEQQWQPALTYGGESYEN
ncbi:hypothetical protein F5B20DRAFT_550499 [Whalleya microplaca]|nr:hypothetical protein F5B20DRAFT_550499 [Whalleya microplaca]